ncbi:hypothetical protein AcW1_006488 [Taiwanofungus camphoratus]|nr:hypothetical protein AcW1_006488 [Antrodia cinnamomea]
MTRAHPFTKPNADIVLRSSDGIDFRVHKLILSEASPVFEGMFALPQLAASSRDSESNTAHADCDGLPVVAVTEKGKTLENLLRICYPMADPVLDAVEEEEVLKAAQKYEIEAAVTLMRKQDVLCDGTYHSRLATHLRLYLLKLSFAFWNTEYGVLERH